MSRFEVGEVLEVKERIEVSNKITPVSYCIVVSVDYKTVELEFYDERRITIDINERSEADIIHSDRINKTNKDMARIALEYRDELS